MSFLLNSSKDEAVASSDDIQETQEKLFLLEFLVESVYIYKGCARDLGVPEWIFQGLSSVAFQFMTFPTLEITQNENHCPAEEPQTFDSGKSCLFSLPEAMLRNAPGELVVHVYVNKKLPNSSTGESFPVGTSTIDMTTEFFSVVNDILDKPNEIPATAARRGRFLVIGNMTNKPVGTIHLYIRLSCFGKLIASQPFTLDV